MKEFIKNRLREGLVKEQELRFNDGKLNKSGPNTIYLDDEPIVDFGIGEIGTIKVGNATISNAIYLKGGYNAATQRMGYGTLGIKFIFDKLPKIQNIVMDCYDTACPFWINIGGEKILSRDLTGSGKELHTVVVTRDNFKNSVL